MTENQLCSASYGIFTLCRKIGCCLRCSLRFSGNVLSNDTNLYLGDQQSKLETNKCVVCLGILQEDFLRTSCTKVLNNILELEYDCSTVTFTLNIPNSVHIRERAVFIYLTQISDFGTRLIRNKSRILSVRDVWRIYVSNEMESSVKLNKTFDSSSPLQTDILMSYANDEQECRDLCMNLKNADHIRKWGNSRRWESITKKAINEILSSITDDEIKYSIAIPPKSPEHAIEIVDVISRHDSIFIGGRYFKYCRRLSQTPWIIQGKLKMENSIQDLICQYMIDYTKAENVKFLSSGREDVDVRMLGTGRPFAIELVNPKITKSLQQDLVHIVKKINDNTRMIQIVSDLEILSRNSLKKLKEGELSKLKTYRALCICENGQDWTSVLKKLNDIRNMIIIQNTPIRVLHRRTLCPRKRMIYEIRARLPSTQELKNYEKITNYHLTSQQFIILDLKTQAGTYIKEFIHGDFGRTRPNLISILGMDIDMIALDVMSIALEWP